MKLNRLYRQDGEEAEPTRGEKCENDDRGHAHCRVIYPPAGLPIRRMNAAGFADDPSCGHAEGRHALGALLPQPRGFEGFVPALWNIQNVLTRRSSTVYTRGWLLRPPRPITSSEVGGVRDDDLDRRR